MTRKIDTDAEIDSVRLKNQGANPSAPATGYWSLFTKNDGLYLLNGASGSVFGPHGGWIPVFDAWTYESADDPTFTLVSSGNHTGTYSPGMRIKLTQTTDKFFLLHNVTASGSTTTLTLYGGTDYDLANAAITSPYYSREKAPQGFPLSPIKWTVSTSDTSTRTQNTPVSLTWYTLGSLSIDVPIGAWFLGYQVGAGTTDATSQFMQVQTALSTATGSASDGELQTDLQYLSPSGNNQNIPCKKDKFILVTQNTRYYLITRVAVANVDAVNNYGGVGTTILRAIDAYL